MNPGKMFADFVDFINVNSGSIQILLTIIGFLAITKNQLIQEKYDERLNNMKKTNEALSTDSDGNELNLIDVLYADGSEVSENIESESDRQMVWQSLKCLSQRERSIMIMRFGLNGDEEKTQKEVADLIGISQSYISRLEKRILGKLKKEIEKIG